MNRESSPGFAETGQRVQYRVVGKGTAKLRKWIKKHRYLLLPCRDLIANMQYSRRGKGTFLVVRAIAERPDFYRDFLSFLEYELPEVRARFRLKLCRSIIRDWSRYVLCIPWVQDPVRERSESLYRRFAALEHRCAQRGIPVANSVACLSNSIKTTAIPLIGDSGCRAAMVRPVGPATLEKRAEELGYPFFFREDRRHGGPVCLLNSEADHASVPWERFRHPCAVEFIDTKGGDGLYRKYRYISAGDFGVPLNLMVSAHWMVRQAAEILEEQRIRLRL